jgi:hypothetical protein
LRRGGQRRGGAHPTGQQRRFVVVPVRGFPVAELTGQVPDRNEALRAAGVADGLVVPSQGVTRLLAEPVQILSTRAGPSRATPTRATAANHDHCRDPEQPAPSSHPAHLHTFPHDGPEELRPKCGCHDSSGTLRPPVRSLARVARNDTLPTRTLIGQIRSSQFSHDGPLVRPETMLRVTGNAPPTDHGVTQDVKPRCHHQDSVGQDPRPAVR